MINQGWSNFPALDRHEDDRPTRLLTDLTGGASDRNAILVTADRAILEYSRSKHVRVLDARA